MKAPRFFSLLVGRIRLYFNACPKCNSDAPDKDSCSICRTWALEHVATYPPSEETKDRWWKDFKEGL